MLSKNLLLTLGFFLSSPIWAITCYYTLAKDNCWNKYNVTVDVMDASTDKILTSVTVPEGQSWTRQTFPCEPGQKLMYRAHFSPMIWESEQGKLYKAKNYWFLPKTVNPKDSAWNLNVCYPSDFSQVPLPPEATGNCQCDLKSIPEIPPKKI